MGLLSKLFKQYKLKKNTLKICWFTERKKEKKNQSYINLKTNWNPWPRGPLREKYMCNLCDLWALCKRRQSLSG